MCASSLCINDDVSDAHVGFRIMDRNHTVDCSHRDGFDDVIYRVRLKEQSCCAQDGMK